jgi:carbamoyl-phosphate synthase large subunit
MNKNLNILVTGCGGDIGQSIGKILLNYRNTKNLFGIDISDKNASQFIYPNFSIGLPCTDKNYLKNLELFIKNNEIDIVIPIAEPELRFFSNQNITEGIGNALFLMASPLALEIGFNKYKTSNFLKNKNFPYPETFLAKDITSIENFPVILKSNTGSGSKEIYKINNMEDFLFYTRDDIEKFVVQEYLTDKNGEFTCGLFRNSLGEIRSQIFKRELIGGYSGFGEVVENNDIKNLLEKLAVELDLTGSINVQLRIIEKLPKIFEINPRFSSTVLFRHLFGFEDLIWSIEDKLGYDLSNYKEPEIGRKFYKGFNEYIK